MMRSRFLLPHLAVLSGLLLAFALTASAQNGQNQNLQVQGKVVRTASDQFVLVGPDQKEVTLFVNPQTRYLLNNKAVAYSDLRNGMNVTAVYTRQGDRFIANNVTFVPQSAPPQPALPPAPPQPGTPPPQPQQPQGTLIEGKIVSIDPDHFALRPGSGGDMVLYVDPKTTFTINNKAAQFKDLHIDNIVAVYFDVRGQRNVARQVVALTAVEGQVVRVVGNDQVILRTPENKEMTFYVTPQTAYQLTPQGGQFTDLTPGSNLGVYYNPIGPRFTAHRFFRRR